MNMASPEESARKTIDDSLFQAGWIIQDRADFNRTAGLGVAVREFLMSDNSEADYLLFVDGKAAGVIEAKKAGVPLSGIERQSEGYRCALPDGVRNWLMPLPFVYESNGSEIYFRDGRDRVCRSRKVFAFHKPETLQEWLNNKDTLRNNLGIMPALNTEGLRDCQIEAIIGLETSFARNKPKALIQMATGAGKTFAACNFVYRLLKHAKAKRILFLVDRNNLGRQAKTEFSNFIPREDNRKFTDMYIVQHLQHNKIDKDAKIVITTIQRLYSMLRGEEYYNEADEEISAYENGILLTPKTLSYSLHVPVEYFDFIITDECHRSIYGDWRQVLEYFDAFIVGLTATPSKLTFGFFNKNLVSEYPYERSVVDKVNVDYQILRIKTDIGEYGGTIDKSFPVPVRDKKTRKTIYEQLDEDIQYEAKDLDRSVLAPNHIRTIIECYKNSIFTDLFPEREPTWIPKTLIFAKDDHHAEEIVRIVREVFAEDNKFCKKITYNVTGEKPEDLIREFRISPYPRIAVTVDMIATGTDIKPLEVVIFMRDVHSELYYEQMKGRGCRSINDTDLQQVTPNALGKSFFYLIDAVGVTESKKIAAQPLERKRFVPLKKLVEQIAQGRVDDDTLSTIAGRITNIERRIEQDDLRLIKDITGGKSMSEIAGDILKSIDPDNITDKTPSEIEQIKDTAVRHFNSPLFRNALLNLSIKTRMYIDEQNPVQIISKDLNKEKSAELVKSFKEFIDRNRDEIIALSIIYNAGYAQRHLTCENIQDLADKMRLARPPLAFADVWHAFEVLEQDRVKKVRNPARLLTNLVQLVRFAFGQDDRLDEFDTVASSRYNLWLGRQLKKGIIWTETQKAWLDMIRDYIISNSYIEKKDVQEAFSDKGGIYKANEVFGSKLEPVLAELSLALAG